MLINYTKDKTTVVIIIIVSSFVRLSITKLDTNNITIAVSFFSTRFKYQTNILRLKQLSQRIKFNSDIPNYLDPEVLFCFLVTFHFTVLSCEEHINVIMYTYNFESLTSHHNQIRQLPQVTRYLQERRNILKKIRNMRLH